MPTRYQCLSSTVVCAATALSLVPACSTGVERYRLSAHQSATGVAAGPLNTRPCREIDGFRFSLCDADLRLSPPPDWLGIRKLPDSTSFRIDTAPGAPDDIYLSISYDGSRHSFAGASLDETRRDTQVLALSGLVWCGETRVTAYDHAYEFMQIGRAVKTRKDGTRNAIPNCQRWSTKDKKRRGRLLEITGQPPAFCCMNAHKLEMTVIEHIAQIAEDGAGWERVVDHCRRESQ